MIDAVFSPASFDELAPIGVDHPSPETPGTVAGKAMSTSATNHDDDDDDDDDDDEIPPPPPDPSGTDSRGFALQLTVRDHEIVLCHPDKRIVQTWERTLSQRARLNSQSRIHEQMLPPGSSVDAPPPEPWKVGAVRVIPGQWIGQGSGDYATVSGRCSSGAGTGTGTGDSYVDMPLCRATLTHDCVLRVVRESSASVLSPVVAATTSAAPSLAASDMTAFQVSASSETPAHNFSGRSSDRDSTGSEVPDPLAPLLELSLATLVSARLLPPHRPILELRASSVRSAGVVSPATWPHTLSAGGGSMASDDSAFQRVLLCFDSEAEVRMLRGRGLGWRGKFLWVWSDASLAHWRLCSCFRMLNCHSLLTVHVSLMCPDAGAGMAGLDPRVATKLQASGRTRSISCDQRLRTSAEVVAA